MIENFSAFKNKERSFSSSLKLWAAGRPLQNHGEMIVDLRSVLIGVAMVFVVFAVAVGIAQPVTFFQ